MENVKTAEDLETKTLHRLAIQRVHERLATKSTDDELMDAAHNSLRDLQKANGRINKDTILKAFIMAAALAEINARRETIFKPVGETPIEEIYGGVFDNLDVIPDLVANTITAGEPFSDEVLDAIGNLIIKICMLSHVRSELFKNTLKHVAKESQRKQAKEEKTKLRQKQRENQMTPGRFWTLLVLGILGFLIIVSSR